MLGMDAAGFEKFFGKIHATVNTFNARQHDLRESEQIVEISCLLLDTAINHHQSESVYLTLKSAKIYDAILELLKLIMVVDMRMDDAEYEKAEIIRHSLLALEACGIHPFGHENHSRWDDQGLREQSQSEALSFAKANFIKFTRFTYDLAQKPGLVPNLFRDPSYTKCLTLYKKVRGLSTSASLIEKQTQ